MSSIPKRGFSIIEIIVIVVVVALVGFLAWRAYEALTDEEAVTESTTSNSIDESNSDEDLPKLESKSDLSAAQATVESVDPDQLDTTELDTVLVE